MPGRLFNNSDAGVVPGQQFISAEDRPVPAVRKYVRGLADLQNGSSLYAGRTERRDSSLHDGRTERRESSLHDGRTERRDGGLHAGEVKTHAASGAEMTASRRLEERQQYQLANSLPSYQLPGQPLKAAAMYRPQSAMAFSSSSSSHNQTKVVHPARPPSSLGVSWDPSPVMSGINGNMESRLKPYEDSALSRQNMVFHQNGQVRYTDTDFNLPMHQRSQSYGDGVTLGEGYSAMPYTSRKSEDVYASAARRQDRVKNVEPALGYDATSQKYSYRQQTQVIDKHPVTSGLPRGESNAGRNHGQDNLAFVADDQPNTSGEITARPPSTNFDLRSAWQRLYGNSSDTAASSRRPSIDDVLSPRKTPTFDDTLNTQSTRQQNGYLPSPQLTQPHLQHPHIVRSALKEPTHNTTGTSSQNGRVTPSQNLTTTDLHVGSSSTDHRRTIIRESPTGQSSSNPDPTSGSNNSSQLSAYSVPSKTFSTFKPQRKKSDGDLDPTIGPSSKYPEIQMGMRTSTQTPRQAVTQKRNGNLSEDRRTSSRQSLSSPNFALNSKSPRQNSSTSDVGFSIKEDLTRPPSRFTSAFLDSDESFGDEYSLKPLDSIFDYHEEGSEDGSAAPRASSQVTPSASSQTPRVTSKRSENSTPATVSPRFAHRTSPGITQPGFVPKTPDLLRKSQEAKTDLQPTNSHVSGAAIRQTQKKLKTQLSGNSKEYWRPEDGQHSNKARSRSLDDVRESENDSLLSFDVENTILTVEPSDQSDMGTVHSHKGGNSVRAQLSRLEGMYSHVIKTLEESSHGTRTRRRWSIGSSDTSSMRHHTHQGRHSRTSAHRLGGRDVKGIGKRFQRLESHVITLARSVAHLSSELRVQNSLSREMENVKREIQELKSQSSTCPATPGNLARPNRLLTDFERYQGWVPSLTNPRRVNKLTKFFGQEPPLLEIFLKQLGYEKFLKNFEQEHIGMIELPYMTEDKLQCLGIPMGPRLRILQEAQVYFKQANLDVYFV